MATEDVTGTNQPDFIAFSPPSAPPITGRRGAIVTVKTTPTAAQRRGLIVLPLMLMPFLLIISPQAIPQIISAINWNYQKVAVQAYFDALARGDSAAAVAQGLSAPIDTTFINDSTLRSALDHAPLTDIRLSQGANDSAWATYKIGGMETTAKVLLINTADGWKLESPTTTFTLDDDQSLVTINGIPIANKRLLELLPGDYPLAAINDRVRVTDADLVVSFTSGYTRARAELTTEGTNEVRAAAQAKLKECLNQDTLTPAGCGFGILDAGFTPTKVKWEITKGADAIKTEDFYILSHESIFEPAGSAVAWFKMNLKATASDAKGTRHTFETTITRASADISGAQVKVTFV